MKASLKHETDLDAQPATVIPAAAGFTAWRWSRDREFVAEPCLLGPVIAWTVRPFGEPVPVVANMKIDEDENEIAIRDPAGRFHCYGDVIERSNGDNVAAFADWVTLIRNQDYWELW